MGRGHLSVGTMILTVEAGRGGEGSFVSRNNDSNCRSRERWGPPHSLVLQLESLFLQTNDPSHLSLVLQLELLFLETNDPSPPLPDSTVRTIVPRDK